MPCYLYEEGKPIGPFEPAQLVLRPGFKKETLVFPLGATTQDAWKPAQAFPDLARALDPDSSGIFLTVAPAREEVRAEQQAAALPAAPAETAAASGAPSLAAPGDKLLLVVDDDETVRSFLELSASLQGFRCSPRWTGSTRARSSSRRRRISSSPTA